MALSSRHTTATLIVTLLLFLIPREVEAQWDPALLEVGDWITSVVETTSGHLFIATLSGSAWIYNLRSETLSEFNGVNGGDVWDFYSHPDGHVILDDGDDLLVSNNGGLSWSTLAPFGEINGFYADGPNWVVSKGDGGAVYRSVNSGEDWYLANGASLPEGRDDYSSDPIYNGETLIYRYTEDLTNGFVLKQRTPYQAFIRQFHSLEYAESFLKSASGNYYAVNGLLDENQSRLVGSTDLENWSIHQYIPLSDATLLAERDDRFAAASLMELAVNAGGLENGDWVSWALPTASTIVTKIYFGLSGHLYLGTDCCLYRSTAVVGTGNEAIEQPEDKSLTLGQAYPNPTLQRATLPLHSSIPQSIRVQFSDPVGRSRVLFDNPQFVGQTEIDIPSDLPAGVYLIKITAGSKVFTRSIVVVD